MTSENVQEMVDRVQSNEDLAKQGIQLYCPCCGEITTHVIVESGTWERMICIACQNEQAFRVR
jgi:hypothetical protein